MSVWSSVVAWFKDLFTMTKPELEEDIDTAEAVIEEAEKVVAVAAVAASGLAPGAAVPLAAAGAGLKVLDSVAQTVEVQVKKGDVQ